VYGVTGPDENHPNVNNSAYVNAVAALSIQTAIEVSNELGLPVPANWSAIAAGIRIHVDAATAVIPEYDGYVLGTRVKQADTIMLGYPLSTWVHSFGDSLPELALNQTVQTATLDYYANYTSPGGPAMTWGLFAIGYLDRHQPAVALANFRRGYANAQPPFFVWTETPSGGCVNFITGAGGFLQSVLNGYGGIRLMGDTLLISPPPLPVNTTTLTLRGINYRGWRIEVRSTPTVFTVAALSASADAKQLMVSRGNAPPVHVHVGGLPLSATRPEKLTVSVQ
jgi:trehalose/maltose hydrolase-like predicted phosphorylase